MRLGKIILAIAIFVFVSIFSHFIIGANPELSVIIGAAAAGFITVVFKFVTG